MYVEKIFLISNMHIYLQQNKFSERLYLDMADVKKEIDESTYSFKLPFWKFFFQTNRGNMKIIKRRMTVLY